MSLTKYPSGSLKELWSISLPLMLSSFSVLMMVFVDRLFLARVSSEAFNAAVTASTLGWSLTLGAMTIASIAEVFVAQYNGSGRYQKLGEPVWQMIWFGVLTTLIYFPISFWVSPLIYGPGRELEYDYFSWMLLFSPTFAIYGALTAFFIGQGKTKLVSFLALGSNFVNILFDWVLIFGVDGWVPEMGVKGAAIATSSSNIFQVLVLGGAFLRKWHRDNHGTGQWQFRLKPFLECLRIGIPGGLAASLEIGGWAAFYEMMIFVGPAYITAAGIGQSMIIILFFFSEALMKGITAVSGNLIGARKEVLISKSFKNGLYLLAGFTLVQLIAYPFVIDQVIDLFLIEIPKHQNNEMVLILKICIFYTIIYLFLDGIRFLIMGILMAAGDTLFLLIANLLSIWFFMVVPTYFFVIKGSASVTQSILITVVYSFLTMVVFYIRYKTGTWKKIHLTDESISTPTV
ncbi:MATE family efflux transporter [Chlamydiales bacterium]|nr:MATE family efflux transporter [Chlamydiales bacterium]